MLDGWIGVMAKNGTAFYSWFQHTFDIPSAWKGSNININFGAVDNEATVFINVSVISRPHYSPHSIS